MPFDVKCPGCQKVYAAEARMIGKKIRCRQCSNVFAVELPDDVAAGPSSADSTIASAKNQSAAGMKAAGNSTAGVTAVAAPPRKKPAVPRTLPAVPAKVGVRPSVPQPFPTSDVLEAWLPLGLGVVAAIWIPAETFSDNKSGVGWVPVLRIFAFIMLYLGVIVPLTLLAVKWNFAKIKKALPPAPLQRVATTFALPATLAYVFWLIGGGFGGFFTGVILGLALVAVVYWLLFRLEPQETANSYAIAGGTFFGSALLSALLLMGASSVLNHLMIASHYSGPLRESPLGEHFAWIDPAKASQNDSPDKSKMDSNAPVVDSGPMTPPPPGATDGTSLAPAVPDGTMPVGPANTTVVGPQPPSTTPKIDDPDGDPALQSPLFGGPKLDSDPFVTSIQDSKLPWVKWVFRPADEGVYEQDITPLTPSPFTGLIRLSGISGKQIECCRLAPVYRGQGSIALDDSSDTAAAGRFALAPDGSVMLRLVNAETQKVEIVPFRGPGTSIALTPPDGKAPAGTAAYAPELLGALPGHRMLVRWSKAEQTVLQVYDYQEAGGTPKASIKLGQSDLPEVYAVSADGNWFGAVEQEAERSFLTLYSLAAPAQAPVLLPVSETTDKAQRACSGIAFSPDGRVVAALLESGKDGVVRSWTIANEKRCAEGACKVPSADEMIGQTRGRSLDWVTNGNWLVHGRMILDATTGSVFGMLTGEVVSGQQMADDHTAYLSYLGTDGHQHLAVVRFNPSLLKASASPAGAAESSAR
jgi:hypothetical protein